jgi:YkoY family integral membrane protein
MDWISIVGNMFPHLDYRFEVADIGVVIAVGILDGLLSVDNALVNASLARHLPERKQMQAIMFGLGMGALLRFVAIFFVAVIIAYPILRVVGAAYLAWLVLNHFVLETKDEVEQEEHAQGAELQRQFVRVIFMLAYTDMAFSIDNVVATVGMSTRILVVIAGVAVSILTMIFATTLVVKLIQRYPRLEHTAFVVIGLVAAAMLIEDGHALFQQIPEIVIPSMVKFSTTILLVVATIAWEEYLRHRNRVIVRL